MTQAQVHLAADGGSHGPVRTPPISFDAWAVHPYTKVLFHSIDLDYVPRSECALTGEQVRKLMQVAHKWAGPDVDDSRSDELEMALRAVRLAHPAVEIQRGTV